METTYRSVIRIPSDTSLPRDAAVNVWHFRGVEPAQSRAADADAIRGLLEDFYTTVDVCYGDTVSSPVTVETVDLGDATPRVPIATDDLVGFGPPGGVSNLPTEAAVCLSFQAAPISGMNQARRRGRVFLGPLHVGMTEVAGGKVLVDDSECLIITGAAGTLLTDAEAAGVPWAIYSPTTHQSASLAASTFFVAEGWVDNAFDTVRSRGTDPATRYLFP